MRSKSICVVSVPEHASSSLECCVARAEAYTVVVFNGRRLYNFFRCLSWARPVFVSSHGLRRCLTAAGRGRDKDMWFVFLITLLLLCLLYLCKTHLW